MSVPQEEAELKLAEVQSNTEAGHERKESLQCEEKELKEDNKEDIANKKTSSFSNKASEGKDTLDNAQQDELAFVKVDRTNASHLSFAANHCLSQKPHTMAGVKEAWRSAQGKRDKEPFSDVRLSSYNADQRVESRLSAAKNANLSINEIIEGEENDEGVLEKSKSSYMESGENKVKLAGSRIAFIASSYQV